MRSLSIGTITCATALATLVGAADAAVIFNNFGPGDEFSVGGRVVQGPDVGTIADINQASSFTVGPANYQMTSVSLGINIMNPPQDGPGPLDVVIAADAGGVPGATLRTLSTNVVAVGEQVVSLPDDGTLELIANTTYWVIADGEGEFNGSWRFNTTGDIGLTAGQTEPNAWNPRAAEERYALRVEGRIGVPEPGTAILALTVTAGCLSIRRRR